MSRRTFRRRTRRNPPIDAALIAVSSLLPYALIGGIIYFYGKDIWAYFGSKLVGVSAEKLKEDASTVWGATKSVASTTWAPFQAVDDATVAGYTKLVYQNTPAVQQQAIAKIKAELVTKKFNLPYPKPASNAEFRANIAAIDAALKKAKGA